MGEMTPEQRAAYMAKHPHLFAGQAVGVRQKVAPAPAALDWTPYESDPDIDAALDALEEQVYTAHRTKGKAAALGVAVRLKAQAGGSRVNMPAGPLDDAAERFMAAVAGARGAKPDAELVQVLDDLARQLQSWAGQAPDAREGQLTDGEKPMAAVKATRSDVDKTLASIRAAGQPSTLGALVRWAMGGK